MLSRFELFDPCLMTGPAGLRGRNFCLGYVFRRFVFVSMAFRAINLILTMHAQLPVGDNAGRHLLMAVHAGLGPGSRDEEYTP